MAISPKANRGNLPDPAWVQRLIEEAHRRYQNHSEGENSQVYPARARVPSGLLRKGIASRGGAENAEEAVKVIVGRNQPEISICAREPVV